MAAVNEVALSVVDLSSMSAAQQNCEDVTKEVRQLGTFSRVVIFVQGQILMCFS